MAQFILQYKENPEKAKGTYYKEKVGIDVETEEGDKRRRTMIKKYVEGLQWVLLYYYRGVQHWRWYYPFHYAPMSSDLRQIVELLGGKTSFQDFEIDFNCSAQNEPYTPFQQLSCILPERSFKLLPAAYYKLIEPLSKYFPADFDIDFNGKSTPWEAVCLIPFVDEKEFLETEAKMLTPGEFTPE